MAANKKITELTTLPDSGGAVFIETVRDGANFKLLCNLQATAAPTITNDSSQGYSVGSIWNHAGVIYTATDVSVGAAVWAKAGALPYKVYKVLLTQGGTDAPTVVTTFENTLGSIVWTRAGVGVYEATLSGAFTQDKTYIHNINFDANSRDGGGFYLYPQSGLVWNSDSLMQLYLFDSGGSPTDLGGGSTDGLYITIEVYP